MRNAFVVGYDKGSWDRTITASMFTPVGTRAETDSSAWYLKNDVTLASTRNPPVAGLAHRRHWTSPKPRSATSLNQRQHAWELGLSQPLGSGVTAYGRVGRSFRLANVDEFSFTNPGVPLQPQTSRDWELGARWKAQAHGSSRRAGTAALCATRSATTRSGTGPFGPFGANVNFDPTRRQGLELSLTQALAATLDLHLNAAWRQARFTSGAYAGNDVMLVPETHVRACAPTGARRPATPSVPVWSGCRARARTSRTAARIPSYATADLRYAYTWRNAEFALGIANLTDHKYYTQAFGCTAGGVTTSIYPEAGSYRHGFDVVQVLGRPMDHDAPIAAGLAPRRIVCLTEETTEWLYLLGQQQRIVGISGYTVRPRQARQEKPRVSAFLSAKIDRILALEPDCVFGFSDLQADIASALIRHGVQVTVFNQRSVEEIFSMLYQVAAIVGEPSQGLQRIAAMRAQLDAHSGGGRRHCRAGHGYFSRSGTRRISARSAGCRS